MMLGDKEIDKWVCAHCQLYYALSECQCDHIIPVGTNSPTTKEEYKMAFDRQEVDVSGLQILCKPCHKVKTKSDVIYQNKAKMISYINDFYEKNRGWCPPITVTLYDNIKIISKIKGLMKKIGETGQDPIRIEKHKKTLEKLIKDTV